MEKIGLIAGNRRFPIVFAEAAKKKNVAIVAVAVKGETARALSRYVDTVYWIRLGEFQKMFGIFKKEGITKVIMAGQISPWRLFSKEVQTNPALNQIITSIKDKKAHTIFSAIADMLQIHGLTLLDSTTYLENYLPVKGVLAKRQPTHEEWESIHFGFTLARQIADLDVGQTVAVKHKAIVAVEGLEGTDKLIRRAGAITRGGIVIVKVSRPRQDMRFDIPVVGLQTIKNLIKARATCLAIEAGKTLFIDRTEALKLADKKKIAVVAV